MASLRERLKSETQDLHQAVERRSPLIGLFRGESWTENHSEAYDEALKLQLDLIDALASHKADWNDKVPSLAAVIATKTALLKDIQSDGEPPISDFNCTAEESIGLGYVLLGSSMGSQVILDKIGGGIPENKRHFLAAMAEASRAFFKFCEEVNAYENKADEVVLGARKAFQHLMTESATAK